MALPIIAAVAFGAAIYHQSQKSHYRNLEQQRVRPNSKGGKHPIAKAPSDNYASNTLVTPSPGSIVCCEVYGILDHTGIWIDEDTIIELGNNGLIKAVSAPRFITERSGENIFVACDQEHQPITIEQTDDRALEQVFTYRKYDVIENNCHRFVGYCLTGRDDKLTRFHSLNELMFKLTGKNIYWDKVKLDKY